MYTIAWWTNDQLGSLGHYEYKIQAGSAYEAIAKFYNTHPEGHIKWVHKI